MANLIVIVVIVGIVGLSLWKVIRDKKRNIPCAGCSACPMGTTCSPAEKEKKEG